MNTDTFIQIIKDRIAFYQIEVDQIMEQNNSTFEKYQQYYSLLENDFNQITNFSMEDIQKILSKIELSDVERDREEKFLKSIKKLLELNQTKGTTFQLSAAQQDYLTLFKQQLKDLMDTTRVLMREQLEGASRITDKIRTLKSLLGKIEDSKNQEYIIDDLALHDLLLSLDEVKQQALLYFVLKYNHSLFEEKMNQQEMDERPRLNVEEVKELFQEYGYDFTNLKSADQDYLLSYGHLNKIRELFDCLQENHFPRFDLRRNGKKLVAVLVHSDVQTVEEIVAYSKEKDISSQTLLLIIPAIIKQTKRHSGRGGNFVGKNSSTIAGRSEDYKKNIAFLESVGFDISFVVKKCRELLIMSHEKLESNYRKFIAYGFEIPRDEYGHLCHPALSCLMSSNFDEIVDQFIEISPNGHQYIQENMSRITTTLSPHDLLFYNIYASYMDQDEFGNEMIPEGPFRNENRREMRLRREIIRYSGSGFENVPYRGITEANKKQKTMTIDIDCEHFEEFQKAVEKHRGNEEQLYDLVFNDDVILGLNPYVDVDDPARYNFDGVLISKQKVLRIYNILKNEHLDSLEDSLLYAITYNSILNQDAFDKIKRIVKDRRK